MSGARILVIGREGQVARALREELPSTGADILAVGRPTVDLLKPESVAVAIRAFKPTLVVLPAAYTAVDKAEDDAETARLVNAVAPGIIATAASAVGAPIIFFSTDYVFDGTKAKPYVETDATAPLGVYGATKLAGEAAVARANLRHVILRTAWVASPTGLNFVRNILRLAAERPSLNVVADQHGAPTFASDLAKAVTIISARLHDGSPLTASHFGVFHIAGGGLTTWHGFASAIVAGAARRGRAPVPVLPIPTSAYPTRAKRPAYSKLATGKIEAAYGITMPDWQTGLEVCLDRLLGSPSAKHTIEGSEE